jgi:arylsulfatase A-like enzyme
MMKFHLLTLTLLSLMMGIDAKAQPGETGPPNIIFILTDDQRWDALGAMGMNDIIQTPHMDTLANQGVMFKNAYVTTAICMASRASIYTGKYQNISISSV